MRAGGALGLHALSLTLSLAVNVGVFYALDRSVSVPDTASWARAKALAQKERQSVEFEFVETPPGPPLGLDKKTRKIGSHDSQSRDPERLNPATGDYPKIKQRGPSDQLAQMKNPSGVPVVPRPPQTAQAPRPAQPQPAAPQPSAASDLKTPAILPPAQPQAPSQPRAASVPTEPMLGLTGADKITTQQMTKSETRGAKLYGMTAFESKGTAMGVYMQNLKEKMWLAWFPSIGFKYPPEHRTADAVIGITLDRQGRVKFVKIVQSWGSPLFATYCMEAVQRAGSFGPVPEEIFALSGKEDVEINFAFHYR